MPTDTTLPPTLLSQQAAWLSRYLPGLRITEQGCVESVGDGITWVTGLPSAALGDLLLFEDGSQAMVFDLAETRIGAILLQATDAITAGTRAYLGTRAVSIPVGNNMLGRVVNPLGQVLDGAMPPRVEDWWPLERAAPPIVHRDFVHEPLYTGIKVIDSLIPIGKGQRQLIIGDEGLGRSSLAIDTVLNQRGKDVICIYVLIGQKRSTVVNTRDILRKHQAMDYTTLVVAEANALPGLQYLAPSAGATLAEYWMQQGKDTLVIYDDLSTHAMIYRELSLLLRRPPGREAYPGDIFSVHARLLERATCLNAANGGGSMTALPIAETKQGEITAYIPTNLISITDGQVYMDQALFSGGFRPAIDISRSVSRIGGKAQHPSIKKEAGRMKLDYLQFLELEVFTRFGARLEASMEHAIKRGRVLREILKQERLRPLPIEFQLSWLTAFNDGMFDPLEAEAIPAQLAKLEHWVASEPLTLEDPRDAWVAGVRECLGLTKQHDAA